jgi:peptidyl-prolyl cis-trans isomerase C
MQIRTTIQAAFVAILTLACPLQAQEADADTVVATVNGTDITLGHMIVLKQRLPAQYQSLPADVLFEGILDQLVQQTILGQAADGLSLGSRKSLENEERALLAAERIQAVTGAAITDEALETVYAETYGKIEPETEYNASHILVQIDDGDSDAARAEAVALIEELDAGAEFALLAEEHSDGPSGPNGGQLGWFGKGVMVEPFEVAVLAMVPGTHSAEPVQTQFGWHVIRLNETRQKDAPSLEEVRGELVDQIQRDAIEAEVTALSDSAEVSRKTAADIDPALLDNLSLLEN